VTEGLMSVALLTVWRNRCAWCRSQVAVSEIEVDHVLPESLEGSDLSEALRLHGKPASYDLQSTSNLVPACRRCNNFKRARVPPDTPIIAIFLQKCEEVADLVDSRVEGLKGKAAVTRALKVLNEYVPGLDLSQDQLHALAAVNAEAQAEIDAATGQRVTLHPSLAGVANAAAWDVLSEGSSGLVVVQQSDQVGYTGPNNIMRCGNCQSYGPWSGSLCLNCGVRDDGD